MRAAGRDVTVHWTVPDVGDLVAYVALSLPRVEIPEAMPLIRVLNLHKRGDERSCVDWWFADRIRGGHTEPETVLYTHVSPGGCRQRLGGLVARLSGRVFIL